MYETVLVPTDGSDASVAAGKAAFALAREFDAEVHALHVLGADSSDPSYGEALVAAIEDAATEANLETTTALVATDESVHRALIEYADENGIDCIVMGTHGREALREYVLGSVAERTLRESPVPVITVHEDTVVSSETERVLVPTDGSDSANAAAEHAAAFAAATGAAVHVIHVVDDRNVDETVHNAFEDAGKRAVEEAIEAAKRADVSNIEASVLSGLPHQAIREYVEHNDIDYVFMGTHGRTGVSRYLLGSVTERVVRLVDVPVVSFKAAEPTD